MMIQCPNCGFSGRVPDYAVGSPHNARCPRCRFRFELGSYIPQFPIAEITSDRSSQLQASSHVRNGDPGSSSYELRAISDDQLDLIATVPDDELDPDMEDGEGLDASRPSNGHVSGLPDPGGRRPLDATRNGESHGLMPSEAAGDPWYTFVLQIWGVVFLAWAGILLLRSLYLMFAGSPSSGDHGDVLATVIAALILVPGSAGLFLLVDLGRYVRGLHPAKLTRTSVKTRLVAGAVSPAVRRFWHPRQTSARLQSS